MDKGYSYVYEKSRAKTNKLVLHEKQRYWLYMLFMRMKTWGCSGETEIRECMQKDTVGESGRMTMGMVGNNIQSWYGSIRFLPMNLDLDQL